LALLSDMIEDFIKKALSDDHGKTEIKRNELAEFFNCVPSQINYVISTRFSGDKGYYVESRRGGGGYILIKRIPMDTDIDYLTHIVMAMGNLISQQTAEIYINNFEDYKVISQREAILLKAATSDKVFSDISVVNRDSFRASILKNMLIGLITEKSGERGGK